MAYRLPKVALTTRGVSVRFRTDAKSGWARECGLACAGPLAIAKPRDEVPHAVSIRGYGQRQRHHHLRGQVSPLLAPRATRLCQAKANSVSSSAPMPTGTTKKLHGMLLTTTTSGSIPAGG